MQVSNYVFNGLLIKANYRIVNNLTIVLLGGALPPPPPQEKKNNIINVVAGINSKHNDTYKAHGYLCLSLEETGPYAIFSSISKLSWKPLGLEVISSYSGFTEATPTSWCLYRSSNSHFFIRILLCHNHVKLLATCTIIASFWV